MKRTVERLLMSMALLVVLLGSPAREARGTDEMVPDPPAAAETEAEKTAREKAEAAAAKAKAEAKDEEEGDKEAEKVDDDDSENGKGGIPWSMILMIGGIVLLFLWMSRKPKKEQQRHEEMISNLKKGDKVTSIGGIVGTVMDVRDEEIIVKVDESSNTRLRFTKGAIRIPKPDSASPGAQPQQPTKEGN